MAAANEASATDPNLHSGAARVQTGSPARGKSSSQLHQPSSNVHQPSLKKTKNSKKIEKGSRIQSAPKKGSEHGKAHRFDWHTLVEAIAFLIGLGIFLYPLIASYVNYSRQTRAIDNYDAIVDRLTPAQRAKMWRDAKQYDRDLNIPHLRDPFSKTSLQPPLNRYWKTLNVDGHGMMAYVEIPKIHVSLPVYHGTSDAVLMKGTGHIATTHLPTDNRTIHSVITGHTGLVGHIFFDNLTQMKKGDTFEIRVLKHHLVYRIDAITVIWPTQVKALQPIPNHNYVTLLTCYPYGINDHRLLVRGKYIGEAKPLTQPTGLPLWFLWLFLLMVLLCVLAEMWCRKRRNHNRMLLDDEAKSLRNLAGQVPQAVHNAAEMAGGDPPDSANLPGTQRKMATAAVSASDAAATGPGKSGKAGKPGQAGSGSRPAGSGAGRLDEKKIRRTMRWQMLGIWVFTLLALFFAWASFGMMMRTGFLPAFDLGYSWWDQHVTYWFSITGMKHLSMPINW